jgi:glutamate synthase (ferredoxin)
MEQSFASTLARTSGGVCTPSRVLPSLIDERFDHDSCGVGFVASVAGAPSHMILQQALTALSRLAHRGATAADGKSSDGVGVMTAIPRALLAKAANLALKEKQVLGVGMLLLPVEETRAEGLIERCLVSHDFEVLGWRDVPVCAEWLGEMALGTMPRIRQVLIVDSGEGEPETMERRLYLARKQFERAHAQGDVTGYICSLSSQTIVYKAMCTGEFLPNFFPDLASDDYVTPFAIFHQRYATNTSPTWHRVQPGRKLGHNGEINTVWGNRARMAARDSTLPVECKPVLTQGGTDSTSLDEAVELLSQNGRTLAESIRMLLPPATDGHHASSFLRYHTDCAEPWDGPAAISFSDGQVVGAVLDRNGLRPCRFAMTRAGLVVAGSEAGLVDLDPEEVIHSGRLGPGQMLVVDLVGHKVFEDESLLELFDAGATYATLVEDAALIPVATSDVDRVALAAVQRGFGYTREDVNMILQPMATEGKDAVWSMGDDTPLAFLARSPRPVYAYFRQRFAQVTNPPIDSLRESCVVSLHTRLGPWPHLLDKNAPLPGVSLPSPFLSVGQVEALRRGEYPHRAELNLAELSAVFGVDKSLTQALDELCMQAIKLVRNGARILLLSDRNASFETLPIPMAMATGAVHQALVDAGLRTLAGLAVEAGDCRDIHHAAVLIGYGAGAVCPWLALETGKSLAPAGTDAMEAERRMLRSLDAGLAKVMSKMGISVVDSYRGAHLFDILGLHSSVVARCFVDTPAPLSGIGFAELERHLRQTWAASDANASASAELPDYGWVRFRKADVSEPHAWQPPTVKALQSVVGSARNVPQPTDAAGAFAMYTRDVIARDPAVLRDLLEIRPAGPELGLSEVETSANLCKRFVASAMSLGSLSPEAHQTITAAMNMLGGRSNTGEGGEDSAVYLVQPVGAEQVDSGEGMSRLARSGGGIALAEPVVVQAPAVHVSLNNKIKQVASGRFGVTAEYLVHAEEIEIKVAQGAKPGEGGQLPGHKVSGLIARLRHAQPGVSLISPPPHHDIYSIEDLAQLIYDLKRVNPKAAVGVKLVSGCGVGTVAAGVAKAYADFIVIAGNTGGTGAAALSSIKYAGNPWELGLAEAQQVLMQSGMRGRVRLRTDGGLATALLGADEYAFGTAVLVTLGCDMARQCHLNTCPTGIATQKPELRAKFRGKPEHVVRFFEQLAGDLRHLLARYGLPSIEAAVGRSDLLEQVKFDGNLDLQPMLAKVSELPGRWMGVRNNQPIVAPPLDEAWVAPALAAVEAGLPFVVESTIANRDRAVGARLAGELALRRAQGDLPADVTFNLDGVAGQSFGAFTVEGMRLVLDGQANDFVGKGLSGGELVIRARGLAAKDSGQHVILGNVALYGATAGKLFAAGRAGERFAVRNSGATAVVEGVGDHGCEYMTGGVVVVLGRVGINFGAGMTGGLAWVYDADGSFVSGLRYHSEFLLPEAFCAVDPESQETLRGLIEMHREQSGSGLAGAMLADWPRGAGAFVRLTPKPQG